MVHGNHEHQIRAQCIQATYSCINCIYIAALLCMCKQAGKPAGKTSATDIQDVAIVCLQQRSSICQHKFAGAFFGALYDARFTLKYF